MTRFKSLAVLAFLATLGAAAPAMAGDCTGYVVGVSPITAYDHAAGRGFLAVRTGPGTGYDQFGELYLGDEISVWEQYGNWYRVQCMTGRCQSPLWGQPNPNGWVFGGYLSIAGVCP